MPKTTKIRVKCTGCRKEFKLDEFVLGETVCPRCGLTSLLREICKEQFDPPRSVSPLKKSFCVCLQCQISWPAGDVTVCPKCGRQDSQIEERSV